MPSFSVIKAIEILDQLSGVSLVVITVLTKRRSGRLCPASTLSLSNRVCVYTRSGFRTCGRQPSRLFENKVPNAHHPAKIKLRGFRADIYSWTATRPRTQVAKQPSLPCPTQPNLAGCLARCSVLINRNAFNSHLGGCFQSRPIRNRGTRVAANTHQPKLS